MSVFPFGKSHNICHGTADSLSRHLFILGIALIMAYHHPDWDLLLTLAQQARSEFTLAMTAILCVYLLSVRHYVARTLLRVVDRQGEVK